MANLKTVSPGDLISAEYMNTLVAYVQDLEVRLSSLESAKPDKVRIDTITPDPLIEEGNIVTIVGDNFSPTTTDNEVTVGTVVITQFKSFGGPQLIQFDMPRITGLSTTGALLPIKVKNKAGSFDTKFRTVKNKILVPGGSGKVVYLQVSVPNADGKLHASDELRFKFRVSATASMAGTYELSTSNDKGWTSRIEGQNPFPLDQAASGTTADQELSVVVTVPVGTPNGTKTTLSVTAKELTPGSNVPFVAAQDLDLTVGAVPPSPDHGIVLAPGPVLHGKFQNGTVMLNSLNGAFGNVALNLTFNKAGTYHVAFAMKDPAGWTLTNPSNVDPPATAVANAPKTVGPNVAVAWDKNAGAKATDLKVTITNDAAVALATYTIPVTLD